jgi:hypothetical protein
VARGKICSMRMPRIRAASAALYLVALLALAMVLAARSQPTAAMRPVNETRSIATANAAQQARDRGGATKTPSPSPSTASSSSPPSWTGFISSVVGAAGFGAFATGIITFISTRKTRKDTLSDYRRDVRQKNREKVDENSEALDNAAWNLYQIRAGLKPDDDNALAKSIEAVIATHKAFRKSAHDSEVVMGTTDRLSGPANDIQRSVVALLEAVPTSVGAEELKPLFLNTRQALNSFNTTLSELVQERGGAE